MSEVRMEEEVEPGSECWSRKVKEEKKEEERVKWKSKEKEKE